MNKPTVSKKAQASPFITIKVKGHPMNVLTRTLTIRVRNPTNELQAVSLFSVNRKPNPEVDITLAESSYEGLLQSIVVKPIGITGLKIRVTDLRQRFKYIQYFMEGRTGKRLQWNYLLPASLMEPVHQNELLMIAHPNRFNIEFNGHNGLEFEMRANSTITFTCTLSHEGYSGKTKFDPEFNQNPKQIIYRSFKNDSENEMTMLADCDYENVKITNMKVFCSNERQFSNQILFEKKEKPEVSLTNMDSPENNIIGFVSGNPFSDKDTTLSSFYTKVLPETTIDFIFTIEKR